MNAPEAAPAVTVMISYELPNVRAALRALLELEPDLDVLAAAVNLDGLLPELQERCPDVLVLGLSLPGMPDPPELELARHAAARAGVVLVGLGERVQERPAVPGAPCYVPLGQAGRALADAVRTAAREPSVACAERICP